MYTYVIRFLGLMLVTLEDSLGMHKKRRILHDTNEERHKGTSVNDMGGVSECKRNQWNEY